MFKPFCDKNNNSKETPGKMGICLKVHSFVMKKYLKKLLVGFYSSNCTLSKNQNGSRQPINPTHLRPEFSGIFAHIGRKNATSFVNRVVGLHFALE